MSKLREAIKNSVQEWCEKMDKEIEEAIARGELPIKTDDELRAEAREIWKKAQKLTRGSEKPRVFVFFIKLSNPLILQGFKGF